MKREKESLRGFDKWRSISHLQRYIEVSHPRKCNIWEVVKCILTYIKGTMDHGLMFNGRSNMTKSIVGHVYVDYGQDLDGGTIYDMVV